MKGFPFLLLLLLPLGCAEPDEGTPVLASIRLDPAPGPARARHVVIISIDGLRPDAIEAAPAPTLLRLIREGAYCPKAETIRPSITLPSHAAMLTGLDYPRHGVSWNNYRRGHIGHPTVFSVATQSGRPAAMFFGKEKFHFLAHPDAVATAVGPAPPNRIPPPEDYNDPVFVESRRKMEEAAAQRRPSFTRSSAVRDPLTTAEGVSRAFAAKWPSQAFPLTFVHFADPDRAGHSRGWMGVDYLDAVRQADRGVERILDTLRESGKLRETAVIVTADHGGSGYGHYSFLAPNRTDNVTIPWICVGPGVAAGLRIDRVVRTYDTAPTALAFLGLGAPEGIDGRAVPEVLSK